MQMTCRSGEADVAPRSGSRSGASTIFNTPLGFSLQSAYITVVGCTSFSLPFLFVTDRPGRINYPRYWGTGGLRKFFMISDSRKAQRNSFARHRATLLFSTRIATVNGPGDWFATTRQGFDPEPIDASQRLKASVRAGIHGFLPIAPAPL